MYTCIAPPLSARLEMGVERVEVGAEIPTHDHEEAEEVIYIISGKARATVNDEEREVGPGDVLYIPPHTSHRIVNIDQRSELWLTFAFSPPVNLNIGGKK